MKFYDYFFGYYIVPYFWGLYVSLRLQDILFNDNITEKGPGNNIKWRNDTWMFPSALLLIGYMTFPIIVGFAILSDPIAIQLMFLVMIFIVIAFTYTFIRHKHMPMLMNHPLITRAK